MSVRKSGWDEKYLLLENFKEQYGHCNVPRNYVIQGFKLGAWVSKQKVLFKKNQLPENRKTKLEEIVNWRLI